MARLALLLKRGSVAVVFLLCLSVYSHVSRDQQQNTVLEDTTIIWDWKPSQNYLNILAHRKDRVREICHKYGLDTKLSINSREFLVNHQHQLIWCNVFKAASSTWLWHFNLLAGYTEEEIKAGGQNPLDLARKRYPRLYQEALMSAISSTPPPLVFMIARHPFIRLVSAYRDKIQGYRLAYRHLNAQILHAHPEMGLGDFMNILKILMGQSPHASFPQFVQYVLDQHRMKFSLNEHWIPMTDFCSPCQVNFTVFAKVETLKDDANYIIHSSGIQNLIKPKVINRAQDGSSDDLADQYLCQLTRKQVLGLIRIYKYDLEMFEYEVDRYLKCASKNREIFA